MIRRCLRPLRLLATFALGTTCAAMMVAWGSSASAATAAPAGQAPGHTIATASQMTLGVQQSGGGGAIDFWLVQLTGGDKLQITAQTPNVDCCQNYGFDLYPPGTSDTSFPTATPVMTGSTPTGSAEGVVILQAPYSGDFVLAVCEGAGSNCGSVASGGGDNPMAAYTFTPSLENGGIASGVGAKETQASPTIANAAVMPLGNFESGGGSAIDFWKVHLLGGDKLQFSAQTPYVDCCQNYGFDLYPPGTTDTSFPTATPAMTGVTPTGSPEGVVVLQAPYSGTFVLAVCQGAGSNCASVDSGGGDNPMDPYTFTPSLEGGGVKASVGAKETPASPTIDGAAVMPLGNFESGGGSAIDFWKVHLLGGDKLQFSAQTPYVDCCQGYAFDLYPPGTTDTNFPSKPPSAISGTPTGSGKSVITLTVRHTGTYILAVCQGVSDCRSLDDGDGDNPMAPYTFTPTLAGKPAAKVTLTLSKSSVAAGSERSLRLSALVKGSDGMPTGTVMFKAGKKAICTAKLTNGKGACSPSSARVLSAGTYSVRAWYGGNSVYGTSKSKPATLKITK